MQRFVRCLSVVSLLLFSASFAQAANVFRVTPYVQHPATNAMSVLWFCDTAGTATLTWWRADADESTASSVQVAGVEAKALGVNPNHVALAAQYKFSHRMTGLDADTAYRYKVTLSGEGGATYVNAFRTAPMAFRPVRFVAYSDSETQTAAKTGDWEDPTVDEDDGSRTGSRKYYVSKEEGFASNVCAMAALKPDFVAVAGDLAGSGDTADHWDQYWKHYAGSLNDCAGATPIVAAPGNHDYADYKGTSDFGEMGMGKYLTYFEYEPNTANVAADQKQRFHRLDYGPVAVIFIDPNNGPNIDPANTYDKWSNEYAKPNDRDTNQCLTEDVCRAPDFNPGSEQYKWVEEQLADAQTNKLFTFLVCHQCPYSIGYHGRRNSEKGLIDGEGEYLSGVPTRCYTNLVFKYGVDGWICGHDEICEHSRLTGVEELPGGGTTNTEVHVYDVGYGGDDLRGARRTSEPNPYEVFRAHVNAPEVYKDGVLVSGGKHYGHLEVNVTTNELGQWVCRLQQNYVFISKDKSGKLFFDRRTYPDVVVLTNTTYKAAAPEPPAPPEPVDTAIHVETDGNDETGDGTVAKPYATIAKALAVAVADDVIKVGEGTFYATNSLSVDKVVTIEGAGRDETILTREAGKTGFRCAYITANATLRNLTVSDYRSMLDGAGIYMKAGTLDAVRITGIYQEASGDNQGAAVYMESGSITNSLIDHNYLAANYHGTKGIGVYMSGGSVLDSTICWNTMARNQHHGLGIYATGASVIRRCTIYKNYSTVNQDSDVDGLYLAGTSVAEDCNIYSNGMNGVYIGGGTLRNSLVYGHNRNGSSFAGVYLNSGTLVNCTIAANTSTGTKSGLDMAGGTAVNNIIYGNGTLGDIAVAGGTFMTNIVGNAVARGTGNLVSDPKFKDVAVADFRLLFGSPAIDAAATRSDVTADLDGTARPQGNAPDIGCYEFSSKGGALQCAAVLSTQRVGEGDAPEAHVLVAGGDGSAITYAWYLDNVLVEGETGPKYTPTGASIGTHGVKVVVTQGGASVPSEVSSFTVAPYEVYVDKDGDDEPPYNSPTKAAHALADALEAMWTAPGRTSKVHLAAGEYELTSMQTLSTDVRFLGSGRDVTVVNGRKLGSSFRAFTVANDSARLQDLTVTGCTNSLDGAVVYLKNGTLDNVRLTRNYQKSSGDNQGAAVYMEGGTVTNALIDHNYLEATYYGTKGIGVYMSGGSVLDSTICWNTMARNQHHGLGIYATGASVIRRCTIYKNYSTGNEDGDVDGLYLAGTSVAVDCNIYSNGMNGVCIDGGTLKNSVVYGHRRSGDLFSGVRLSSGSLVNCTISDNTATGDTTGKSGLYQTGGTAVNNIIYGNGGASLGSCYVTGGTFKYNVTDKLACENGYVADPKFVNAATNDFRLRKGSPALDKASDVGLDHDLDGRARPLGDGYDIGCYEAIPTQDPVVAITAPVVSYRAGSTLEATADLKNIDVATSRITWSLTGAATATYEGVGEEYLSFSYPEAVAGAYSLMLSVKVGEETYSADQPTAFAVKPNEVYVGLGKSGTFPYDDPDKATDNLNEALDALWQVGSEVSTVHVAAGDYVLHDVITLATPVRILGAGRDETRLHGTGISSDKRAFALKHDGACLADFTLCGVTNRIYGGGSAVRLETGRLENVRVTGTWVLPTSGSVAVTSVGLYMQGGTVTNCVFDHNSGAAGWGWTSGLGVTMSGGLLVDCEISDSSLNRNEYSGLGLSMSGGTARRCRIHHITGWRANNTYGAGLTVSGGTVEDCIISDCTYGAYVTGSGTLRNSVVANCQGSQPKDDASVVKTGGVIQDDGTVINCTLAGNGSAAAEQADYVISGGTSKNNIAPFAKLSGGTRANNVFNVDPKIRNVKAGKYRLTAGSPAIGAADKAAWTWSDLGTAKDVLGNPRVYHRGKSDERFDCGACTYIPTGLMLLVR